MIYTNSDHTFAVCAHNESPYLEDVVKSLVSQTVKTNIIMATSTPNNYISNIAKKYDIPLYINSVKTDATGSWTFAINCAQTALITICHQDDIYEPLYAERIIKAFNSVEQPIMAFTDYMELRNGEKIYKNKILAVKRLMLKPLKIFKNNIFVRRRILSLGNPICCPSVTYLRDMLIDHPFPTNHIGNQDWAEYEILSREKGGFLYVEEPLVCHRIHTGSATSEYIGNNLRTNEDYAFFCKFWPRPIAKLITKLYETSENSNNLD